MNRDTARHELRNAALAGFCPTCFARAELAGRVLHEPDCKLINDAGVPPGGLVRRDNPPKEN